jgi:hypothetical protein
MATNAHHKKPVIPERAYPWTDTIGGREIAFRLLTADDRDAVLAFGKALPEEVVIFLRMDLSDPKVIDEWIENVQRGRTCTVLALADETVVGYGSLHHDDLLWTRHMGELRVLANDNETDGNVLRQRLANEVFHIAKELDLMRVVVHIPNDQRGLLTMFEKMGFKPEALLTDWLMTGNGRTHDLLVLSQYVNEYGH